MEWDVLVEADGNAGQQIVIGRLASRLFAAPVGVLIDAPYQGLVGRRLLVRFFECLAQFKPQGIWSVGRVQAGRQFREDIAGLFSPVVHSLLSVSAAGHPS